MDQKPTGEEPSPAAKTVEEARRILEEEVVDDGQGYSSRWVYVPVADLRDLLLLVERQAATLLQLEKLTQPVAALQEVDDDRLTDAQDGERKFAEVLRNLLATPADELLAAVKADAWDEGRERTLAGWFSEAPFHPNPYRASTSAE